MRATRRKRPTNAISAPIIFPDAVIRARRAFAAEMQRIVSQANEEAAMRDLEAETAAFAHLADRAPQRVAALAPVARDGHDEAAGQREWETGVVRELIKAAE